MHIAPISRLCATSTCVPAWRAIRSSPLAWSGSPDWKLDFQNVAQMSPEEIARRRAEFDKQKEVAKTIREEVGVQRARA